MNKQQKIFNILAKEQKSMKVELGAIDDIKKQQEQISQEYDELVRSARRYLGELDSIADKASALSKKSNSAVDAANQLAKKINELGIDMPSELSSAYREIAAIRSDADQLAQVTRKASDAIGGIE